jgi:tRNA pseudouridine38-40 synthase
MTKRYFIKLSFNGKEYHGWQIQNNSITVQGKLNQALSLILNHKINVIGAGRTDAGVHAKNFFAHFDFNHYFNEKEKISLIFKLNNFLPSDIVIHDIIKVKDDAHVRFDAILRTYKYYISRTKNPFNKNFSYYFYGKLNIALMNKGAKKISEYEDFSCFSKSHTQTKTNICKITYAKFEQQNNMLIFTITANRFLRDMVRAIIGTLLNLGQGKIKLNDFKKIIESKNRSNAGKSVDAQGLFLTEIVYPDHIFKSFP